MMRDRDWWLDDVDDLPDEPPETDGWRREQEGDHDWWDDPDEDDKDDG